MPDVALLTPTGERFRAMIPVAFRDSPEHLAVLHAQAVEFERLRRSIDEVRAQFTPQTATILLRLFERVLGLTVEPEGVSVEDRRVRVMAQIKLMLGDPSGLAWQAAVTRMIGPSWSYREHVPGGRTPPDDTLEVTLPYPPGSVSYALTERLLRTVTPSHIDLIITYEAGFLLDVSELDEEEL